MFGRVEIIIKWNYLKYWFVFEYLYLNLCYFPLKFSIWLVFLKECSVYIIRNIMVVPSIVHVIFGCSFWTFNPELTQYLEIFVPVSSTVPVCWIAVDCKLALFAVEYKKLRIRHNVLYEKIYIPVVLNISFLLFAVIEIRHLMMLKGTYENIYYLHNTCGWHVYT